MATGFLVADEFKTGRASSRAPRQLQPILGQEPQELSFTYPHFEDLLSYVLPMSGCKGRPKLASSQVLVGAQAQEGEIDGLEV